jgi:hypothetical protein
MKITRRRLIKIIREAMDPIRVKTLAPEDFDPPVWSDATEPKSSEEPLKRVGNFFMTKTDAERLPKRGYGAVKKLKNFYMVLPDGDGIKIGPFPGEPSIAKVKDGVRYLEALDAAVDVLPVGDALKPSQEDMQNMLAMQDQIMAVARGFSL